MALPVGFVSFKSKMSNKYLSYEVKEGEYHGFLHTSGDKLLTPYSKFQVEESETSPGLVHLKCCYHNKYLVRNSSEGEWIVGGANEKEEDKAKWSCTLFNPISVTDEDGGDKVEVELVHVQSGEYACVSKTRDSSIYVGLSQNPTKDGNQSGVYTIVNWANIPILPQYVAFKAQDDDKYLKSYIDQMPIGGSPTYCHFLANEIAEPNVAHEFVFTSDDHDQVHIRNLTLDMYLCCSSDRGKVFPLPKEPQVSGDLITAFQPIKLEKDVVVLKSLLNNLFCVRFDGDEFGPRSSTMIQSSRLTIEENVVLRSIYDVVYHFDDAKIYDIEDVTAVSQTYDNHGSQPDTYKFTVDYEHTRSKTWNSTITAKLGVTTTVTAKVPFVAEVGIETSFEFSGEYQWGETEEETLTIGNEYPITVPGGMRRKAEFVGKKGKCDLPFSYIQKDLMYDGTENVHTLSDGIYTGANYYDFKFVAGPEEPL